MKKSIRYTFRILSVIFLLSMTPSFPTLATADTPETVQPAPDTAQPGDSAPETSQPAPSESIDVAPPDAPVQNVPPTAETPAPDTAPSDANTETAPEPFTVTDFSGTYYVATENDLNVRSGPSTSYTPLGKLSPGQEITVTGKTDNDWYRIQYTANREGYVSAQYLSDTPVHSEPSSSSPEAEAETPAESAAPENPTVSEPDAETPETETEPSTYIEHSTSFIGAHITIILVLCILVVVLLIGFSVYGLFHHETSAYEEEDEDYDADGDYADEDTGVYYEDDGQTAESYGDPQDYYEGDGQDAEPYGDPQDYYENNGQDAEPYETPEAYYEDDTRRNLNAASARNDNAAGTYYGENEYTGEYAGDDEILADEDIYIEDINDEDILSEDVNDVFDEDEYDN